MIFFQSNKAPIKKSDDELNMRYNMMKIQQNNCGVLTVILTSKLANKILLQTGQYR